MYKYFISFIFGVLITAISILLLNSKNFGNPKSTEPIKTNNDYTYTIGLLGHSDAIKSVFEGFKTQMNDIIKEKNITIKYETLDISFTNNNIKNATEYFNNHGVNLIVTGQSEFIIFQQMGITLPIIVAPASNVVLAGLAKSMEGSGNNGVFIDSGNSETASKRLEYFMKIKPNAKNILILRGTPESLGESNKAFDNLQVVAKKYNLNLIDKNFESRSDLNKFILKYDFSQVDAIFRYPGPFMASNIDLVFKLETTINKPIIALTKGELTQGGVISYSTDYKILGQKAANVAYQILTKKTDPSTIPVQTPIKFDFGINFNTIKKYNLSVPQEIKEEADYTIE